MWSCHSSQVVLWQIIPVLAMVLNGHTLTAERLRRLSLVSHVFSLLGEIHSLLGLRFIAFIALKDSPQKFTLMKRSSHPRLL